MQERTLEETGLQRDAPYYRSSLHLTPVESCSRYLPHCSSCTWRWNEDTSNWTVCKTESGAQMIPTSAPGLLLVGGWDPTGITELVKASSKDRLPVFFQSNLTTHPLSVCCCLPFTCSAFSADKLFHLSKSLLFGLVFPFWAVQDIEEILAFSFSIWCLRICWEL